MRSSQALEASGLAPDLPALRKRDLTWLGDRGTALSGGQRARCGARGATAAACLLDQPWPHARLVKEQPLSLPSPSGGLRGRGGKACRQGVAALLRALVAGRVGLARALYSQCQVLLLDDVLASLDASTAALVTAALLGPPPAHVGGGGPGAAERAGEGVGVAGASLLAGRTTVVVTQSTRCALCGRMVAA